MARSSILRAVFLQLAAGNAEQFAELHALQVAQRLGYAEAGDSDSRALASEQIVQQNLHGRALKELLLHGNGETTMWLARTLAASQTIDGRVFELVNWLREEITQSSETAPARVGASTGNPGKACEATNARILSSKAEVEVAEGVRGLPKHSRQAALHSHLLKDYMFEVPPEGASVEVSINFFKITALDLKASTLHLPVWFRQQWRDPRLAFNSSLWGIDSTLFLADEGSLENTRIWTPEVELYNSEYKMAETLGVQKARVASDGTVWWSRLGTLQVLCKFQGLQNFPLDSLSCTLEFGGWAADNGVQNLSLRAADGGFHFPSKSGEGGTSTTSGSTFQEYIISNVEAYSIQETYNCCPHAFTQLIYTVQVSRASSFFVLKLVVPQLVMAGLSYLTYFMSPDIGERLGFGITLMLAVFATDIVATEFMPVCKEMLRMNYISFLSAFLCAIALFESGVVLAFHHMESFDSAVPRFMKWCLHRKVLNPCLSVICCIYKGLRDRCTRSKRVSAAASNHSFESPQDSAGIVVPHTSFEPPPAVKHGEHGSAAADPVMVDEHCLRADAPGSSKQAAQAWQDKSEQLAVEPIGSSLPQLVVTEVCSEVSPKKTPRRSPTGDYLLQDCQTEIRIRWQLYREAFNMLDDDFSGKLETSEVSNFGHYMMGDDWDEELLHNFMEADLDNSGGLSYQEFSTFCEKCVLDSTESKEINYVSEMIKGFLSYAKSVQRKNLALSQSRARRIDYAFRWIVPVVFCFFPFILLHDFVGP